MMCFAEEPVTLADKYSMLTTFPHCNFSMEFPEILYAIIEWVCLGIPK